jgi:hypothetical protein
VTVGQAIELVGRHRRTGVLIDANLLVMLMIGEIDPSHIAKYERTNKYEEVDYEFLSSLLGTNVSLVVTPHVAAEVSNLGNKLTGKYHEDFLRLLDVFIQRCRERWTEARFVVGDPDYLRLGLTDAGLLGMKRNSPLVITDDLDLYLALETRRRPTIKYAHLMEEIRGV